MRPDVLVEVNGKIWSFEIAGINDVLIIISSVIFKFFYEVSTNYYSETQF